MNTPPTASVRHPPPLPPHTNPQVEGTCSGKYGFIITVTAVDSVGQGAIRDGAGSALFTLRYSALVFRPSRGEVLDCVVASVSKVGFFADAGPMQVRERAERGG